jgi:protein-tyrosine phosphatase
MPKISAAILSLCFAWSSYSPAQVSTGTKPPGSSHEQMAAGTTLAHFGKVDDGVYKGSRPRTDTDYRLLQSLHVKYILDLQLLPLLQREEQKRAKRYGMEIIHARINASPVQPSEKHIASILAILRDKRYRPIYFHCALGRDRTALVAALYKMYFLGMSQRDAWRYMQEAGFKEAWIRNGLEKYLLNHPTAPANVAPAVRESALK